MSKLTLFFSAFFGLAIALGAVLGFFSFRAIDNPQPNLPQALGAKDGPVNPPGSVQVTALREPEAGPSPQASRASRPDCELPFRDIDEQGESDDALVDRWSEARDQIIQRLADAGDPEHVMVAALYETDLQRRLGLFNRAIALAPNNPLLLWSAVAACNRGGEKAQCPSHDWLQRLSQIDSNNSDVWMSLAVEQWQAGDSEGALASLQRAANGYENNIYYADAIEMTVRAFTAAGSDLPFPVIAGYAFGNATKMSPNYRGYYELCTALGDTDAQAAGFCLQFAENAAERYHVELGQLVANQLEMAMLNKLGEPDLAEQVLQRRQQTRAEQSATVNSQAIQVEKQLEEYIVYGPNQLASYLATLRQVGEVAAREQMYSEMKIFERGYLPKECSQ